MSTIVTRAGKGSALTWTEGDANITNLNTDKLENITTEVQPTSLASAPSASPINIEILSEEVLKSLTYDQSDLFKQGKAFIGNKPVTTTSILRDILYMEVEELQMKVLTKVLVMMHILYLHLLRKK